MGSKDLYTKKFLGVAIIPGTTLSEPLLSAFEA